jgi:hypothetical protein
MMPREAGEPPLVPAPQIVSLVHFTARRRRMGWDHALIAGDLAMSGLGRLVHRGDDIGDSDLGGRA